MSNKQYEKIGRDVIRKSADAMILSSTYLICPYCMGKFERYSGDSTRKFKMYFLAHVYSCRENFVDNSIGVKNGE